MGKSTVTVDFTVSKATDEMLKNVLTMFEGYYAAFDTESDVTAPMVLNAGLCEALKVLPYYLRGDDKAYYSWVLEWADCADGLTLDNPSTYPEVGSDAVTYNFGMNKGLLPWEAEVKELCQDKGIDYVRLVNAWMLADFAMLYGHYPLDEHYALDGIQDTWGYMAELVTPKWEKLVRRIVYRIVQGFRGITKSYTFGYYKSGMYRDDYPYTVLERLRRWLDSTTSPMLRWSMRGRRWLKELGDYEPCC